ncbi:hypothetical protein A9X03_14210 [Mycobacterium sp. E1715]|uniref:phage major capsid protein n=1 Tax=Mycobacterium sp. E1715 TaxID=1856863 RepID=UPI000801D00D|nr:phage major capsid protein [Mycobacterium sp. E1715]OBH23903.1 hypothetical protein A9X03_14210 [Mycobacterium sp. E1715]
MNDHDFRAECDRLLGELDDIQASGDRSPRTLARMQKVNNDLRRLAADDTLARQADLAEGVRAGRYRLESGTPTDTDPYAADRGGTRNAALRALDDAVRDNRLAAAGAELVEQVMGDGPEFARTWTQRYVAAAGSPDYERAYAKLVCDPSRGHLKWSPAEQQAYQRVAVLRQEQRAMGESATHGSELVPLTLDPTVLLTSAGSINPLRRIARTVVTATDAWQGVTSEGVVAEWLDEAEEAADASPALAGPSIPVKKLGCFVPVSYELFEDVASLTTELGRLMSDAYDQLTATAFTTGSGVGEPTGLITGLVAAAGTVALITPTTGESFTAPDVFKLQNSLPPRWQPRAQWCANLTRINDARQWETSNGALKFPSLQDDPPTLLGRPMNELSNMDGTAIDASATADHYALVYGSFGDGFVIVQRLGATTELISNLFGENRRPTGQRGVFLWARTGSAVVIPQAFRLLSIHTTA